MKSLQIVTSLSVILVLFSIKGNAQTYNQNQYEIDRNYGGVGVSFTRPNFGKGTIERRWFGVNVLSDVFQLEFLVGQTDKIQPIVNKDVFQPQVADYGSDYGYLLTMGFKSPINILTFGAYQNSYKVLRGHPTLGTGLGYGKFESTEKIGPEAKLYFWDLNMGYRVRMPLGSIEFNLNARLGWSDIKKADYGQKFYRGTGISPSITFRFDAFKGILNPHMVSANMTAVSVSNVKSETTRTGSRYRGDGSRVDTYTTTTTGDVSVTSGQIGVQDIGPHFGIGPKISFMNPRRSKHINRGMLIGIVAEGRANVIDFGLTLEGGRVGHGSALEYTGIDEARKKLNKKNSLPQGTVNTVNLFANIGFDISPAFLVPFGISLDKGESTSFFSATAGFNIGIHAAFGQRYDDPASAAVVADFVADNVHEELKQKYLDPAQVGVGLLGGFYFSLQVGAASFKITNYRYYGAPFASTTMLGIAWRLPVIYDL